MANYDAMPDLNVLHVFFQQCNDLEGHVEGSGGWTIRFSQGLQHARCFKATSPDNQDCYIYRDHNKRIDVHFCMDTKPQGSMIMVVDNGCGMGLLDIEQWYVPKMCFCFFGGVNQFVIF